MGPDRGIDHRRAHRADRHAVHRATARGHAARAEPVRAAGRPQRAGPAAADHVGRTVNDLFSAVTIVNPGGSYTLATEHSPLPLALRNDLPVPIRVRLQVDAPPGMSVTDMGEIELPPGYLPLRVPIEVHFTQRVAVDVALRTADGLPLGEPVRLSVHSNAYGQVLFFITLSGGAVLVAAGRPPAMAPVPRPARPRRPGPAGPASRSRSPTAATSTSRRAP